MILSLLLFISLSVQSHSALEGITTQAAIIRYDRRLIHAAEEIASKFPRIRREVEQKVGEALISAPVIVILRDRSEFQTYAGNEQVTAFAVPREHLIVIDYSKMRNGFDITSTLKHELTHLLLAEDSRNLFPKWFDEGTAQWAGGGITDLLDSGGENLLRRAAITGTLLRLDQLSNNFPTEPPTLLLAYQEGKSMVEYISKEYGDESLRAIISDVKSGKNFDVAIRDATSFDQSSIEHKWRKYLSRRYAWPAYAADNIYLILFVLAAAATLTAYLRFRKRFREYRDEDDQKDDNFSE